MYSSAAIVGYLSFHSSPIRIRIGKVMRHGNTPDVGVPGRRRHMPELPTTYSGESDPVQRLLAFAYLQAQKGQREATEELRKDADTLSAVLAAQNQIAAAHFDLEQSLEFIAEGARRLTGAGGAAIALREGRTVVCRGRSGLIAPDLGSRLNPESGISGQCLTRGEVQLCDDTEQDPRVDVWVCRNLGIRSILAVPLRRQQDLLGIIVAFSGWAGVFGERDIRALKLLAGLVIEALWSHEVRQHQTPAPELKVEASSPIEDMSVEAEQILESMPEPAAPESQVAIAKVPALVEPQAAAAAVGTGMRRPAARKDPGGHRRGRRAGQQCSALARLPRTSFSPTGGGCATRSNARSQHDPGGRDGHSSPRRSAGG